MKKSRIFTLAAGAVAAVSLAACAPTPPTTASSPSATISIAGGGSTNNGYSVSSTVWATRQLTNFKPDTVAVWNDGHRTHLKIGAGSSSMGANFVNGVWLAVPGTLKNGTYTLDTLSPDKTTTSGGSVNATDGCDALKGQMTVANLQTGGAPIGNFSNSSGAVGVNSVDLTFNGSCVARGGESAVPLNFTVSYR